jgi:hypothetical protein
MTDPAGTVGLLPKLTAGFSPRLVSWLSAVAWVWFRTSGTVVYTIGGGPEETTMTTTESRAATSPLPGSVRMTLPSGTDELS